MGNETVSLTLEPRQVTGKSVKHLRREGTIPAVIHDHGKDSVIVQGSYLEMMRVWQRAGKHHPVELKAGNKTFTALIKTAEFDPKKHQLTHIVFNAVNANEKVEAEIPIQPRYAEGDEASPAEQSGLLVLSQLETVNVAAVPSKLPDVLYYDASKLVDVGDSLSVSDLVVPPEIELKTDPSHSVATVYEPSAMAAANEAAGGDAEDEGEPAEDEAAGEDAGSAEAEAPTGESGEGKAETAETNSD